MVALLINILSTFVIEINQIDFILTLQKGLTLFPIMHRIYKHSF
jgi:hypothetical protein